MRRILLLVTDLLIGGTPTVVRELALRLRDVPGVHIEVACLAPQGPVGRQLLAAGFAVTPFDARGTFDLPAVTGRLVRLVRERRIDTVLSFLAHANAIAALASLRCGNVRWLQSIQTTQPRPRWHWRVQRFAQHAADRVVVPSTSVAKVARDRAHVPAEKIVVIPNAIDVDEFRNLARAWPAWGTVRIGFIGRLDPIKRVPDLVDAVGHLPQCVRLDIFGEGPERVRIEAVVAALALTARVTLHGAVAGPREALGQIDVLVLPSEAEGFGLVLIEAMAAGVPVVATDAPGIRDVVRADVTGLLVPVGSPKALAGALATLLSDAPRREALIAAAQADVRERFGWGRVLPAYLSVLGIEQGGAEVNAT